jgi:hypothetical protein
MEISPDLLRHIISFDNSSILCARCVCVNWRISLSPYKIKQNGGLESVNVTTYHSSYIYNLGSRTKQYIVHNAPGYFNCGINNCQNIEKIIIHRGMKMSLWSKTPHLTHLEFNRIRIDLNLFAPPLLTTLKISETFVYRLDDFISKCPLIENLSLIRCYTIEDTEIKSMSQNLPLLKSFEFEPAPNCQVLNLSPIAWSCPRLTNLSISRCNIYDDTIAAFARNCTDITKLSLVWCSRITDIVVSLLLSKCSKIEHLVLESIKVSYPTLMTISLPSLVCLKVCCINNPSYFRTRFHEMYPQVRLVISYVPSQQYIYPQNEQPFLRPQIAQPPRHIAQNLNNHLATKKCCIIL